MRIILKFFIICFFLLNISVLNAKENIVFIDLNYVLNKSVDGKKILDELNVINEENKKKFLTKETNLEKERDNIKKLKNIVSNEEYNKKVALFQEKVDYIIKKKQKL